MKAARIHSFGPPKIVVVEDVPVPAPGPSEVLVRVMAAGVAPWDATIREGKSKVSPQPPLTLGSDLSGIIEKIGAGVTGLAPADEVYGVTNPQFCGAQAELAVASAGMVARKPQSLDYVEAASAPVIAVTAWQMLFEYAEAMRGQTVMVVGAAGNVGAYIVQMAVDAGIEVVAVAHLDHEGLLRSLGAKSIIDSGKPAFEQDLPQVDAILDTVGGSTFQRCAAALKPGGKLVTVVSTNPLPAGAIFFYADVTATRLNTLTKLFDAHKITARVGSILPLSEARHAHPTSTAKSSCRSPISSRARYDFANEDMKGKPELKKDPRGLNPASRASCGGCVECPASAEGWWLHLRRCAECGHFGCCDSSPG